MKKQILLAGIIFAIVALQGCNSESEVTFSGVETQNMDLSVRPGDDFFNYANGRWIEKTEIANDSTGENAFKEATTRVKRSTKASILDATKNPSPSPKEKLVADFYLSYMDVATLNAKGDTPLQETLATISKASSKEDIIELFATLQEIGIQTPIVYSIDSDEKNSSQYITNFVQGSTILPVNEYYSSQDQRYVNIRDKYKGYIDSLLALCGFEDTQKIAGDILALETKISEIQWTPEANDIPENLYNKYTKDEAKKLFDSFDLELFLRHAKLDISEMIIKQPSYIENFSKLFDETPIELWKEYLAYRYIITYTPYLSSDFTDLHFAFYGKILNGIKEAKARETNAIEETGVLFSSIIAEMYVNKQRSVEVKAKVQEMTQNIISTFRTSIAELEWMSKSTKEAALIKLNKIKVKIAYPEEYTDYSGVEIKADSLKENIQNIAKWNHENRRAKLGTQVDRTKWKLSPQTVNATYSPNNNDITIPLAILQEPFFYLGADDAINYGAIGSIIGHELTHAFDNRGSKYDGDGDLRDWWSEEDKEAFAKLTEKLVDQYDAYQPIEGDPVHVNGTLTLGENIADLGGLNIAYKAYIKSLNGKKPLVLDSYTAEQRFFLGQAQVWRNKVREQAFRNSLFIKPHAPAIYRVNGVVTNYTSFYKAFDVQVGDKLYKPEDERIKIW